MTATQQPTEATASSSSADAPTSILIPADRVRGVADLVGPMLEKVDQIAAGRFSVLSVLELAVAAQAQLWIIWDPVGEGEVVGVMVTELLDQGESRVVRHFLTATDPGVLALCNVEQILEPIERWAREQGAVAMICEGRRGWGRLLKGYDEVARVWEKEL